MNVIGFLKGRRGEWKLRRAQRVASRFSGVADEITQSQWTESLNNPTNSMSAVSNSSTPDCRNRCASIVPILKLAGAALARDRSM